MADAESVKRLIEVVHVVILHRPLVFIPLVFACGLALTYVILVATAPVKTHFCTADALIIDDDPRYSDVHRNPNDHCRWYSHGKPLPAPYNTPGQ